jgi:ankyrin repeat protein
MSTYIKLSGNQDLFLQLAHTLETEEFSQATTTLKYSKSSGFQVKQIPKEVFSSAIQSESYVTDFTKATSLLLKEVSKQPSGKKETLPHKLERLEATLHTCQQIEKQAGRMEKQFRAVFSRTRGGADPQLFFQLKKVKEDFSEVKRKVAIAALELLGVSTITENILSEFENSSSFLATAFKNKQSDVLMKLIENMDNLALNPSNLEDRSTPLMLACKANLSEVSLKLIDRVDVNKVNNKGETALIMACIEENEDIALQLIDRMDLEALNEQNSDGDNALIIACKKDMPRVASRLIERGVDVNKVNNMGETALIVACTVENEDIALQLISLMDLKALNAVDDRGRTAPIIACKDPPSPNVARKLIQRGADVNGKDDRGDTALIWACREGQGDIALQLIDRMNIEALRWAHSLGPKSANSKLRTSCC